MKNNRGLTAIIMAFVLLLAGQVSAVPAHPGIAKVRQPDGTVVSIRLHGDEYQNYNTTADGYTIMKNPEGYYVYATLEKGQLQPSRWIAHDQAERTADEQAFLHTIGKYTNPQWPTRRSQPSRRAVDTHTSYDLTKFRGLVILVEFKDKAFSRSDFGKIANDMLNKEKFIGILPDNLFAGSVRDYFSDMSAGQFLPEFDVVGPVKINYSQYDANGTENVWKLMNAAINAVDKEVNFRLYDSDGDKFVDLVFFIFAGYGSNYTGNDERLIWPHANTIYDIDKDGQYQWVIKDRVYLNGCACSTELAGWTGEPAYTKIDGIGTIVHEFSHVLGLPDFYDVDYEESGGESRTPGIWDVMAGGCYDTPVGYTLYERWFLGFAEPELIDTEGNYTLDKLSNNVGYRLNSAHRNEFFLLENRQKDDKWNESLPGHGMMVYRVDISNSEIWEENATNNDPSHNYYELLRANPDEFNDSPYDPFPGRGKVTSLTNYTSPANLKSWSGKESKLALVNIKEQNRLITFDVVDAHSEVGIQSPVATPQTGPTTIFTPDGHSISTVSRPGLYILRQGTTTRKIWK